MLWGRPACAAQVSDYTLPVLSTVALIADWGTTLDIENHSNFREKNKYLGSHPTRSEINRYFTKLVFINLVGNYILTRIPNKKLRENIKWMANTVVFCSHGGAAYRNAQLGLSFDF